VTLFEGETICVIPAEGGLPKTWIRQIVSNAANSVIFTKSLARLTS